MNATYQDLIFDPQLIRRFDVNGPRYTSYPTADRFVEAFDADAYRLWLGKRTVGGISRPLSLYVHIPFCNTICYYCACNKIITKDHGRSRHKRNTTQQTHPFRHICNTGNHFKLLPIHINSYGCPISQCQSISINWIQK